MSLEGNATYSWNATATNSTAEIVQVAHADEDNPLAISAGIILACVMVYMFFFCTKPNIPDERLHRGNEIRERAQRRWAQQSAREALEKQPAEERARDVEASIVTKRVISRDKDGNLTLGDVTDADSSSDSSKGNNNEEDCNIDNEESTTATSSDEEAPNHESSASLEEEEDESSTCVICLEPFRVGDNVSWSKLNNKCHHVFHSDCIIPWLQNKHNDCPSCRCEIIKSSVKQEPESKLDESDENDTDDDCEDLELGYNQTASSNNVFVIMHGLVSNARRASYSLIGQSLEPDDDFKDKISDDDDDENSMEGTGVVSRLSAMRRDSMASRHSRRSSLGGSWRDFFTSSSAREASESSDDERDVGKNYSKEDIDLESLRKPISLGRSVSSGPVMGGVFGFKKSQSVDPPGLLPSRSFRRRSSIHRSSVNDLGSLGLDLSEYSDNEEDGLVLNDSLPGGLSFYNDGNLEDEDNEGVVSDDKDESSDVETGE